MKNWTSAASVSESLSLPAPTKLYDEQFVLTDEATQEPLVAVAYRLENAAGQVIASGVTDSQGRTARVIRAKPEKLQVFWGH